MSKPSLDTYDPFDPAVIANPFPYYELLREEAPVYEVEKYGFFVVSRFDDVESVAQNWKEFSTTWGPGPQRVESPVASVLQSDPPVHTRLRSIIAKAFTPRAVKACDELVRELAQERVEAMLELGTADLVDEYAIPIPVVVIAEMLGVPREDRAIFRKWSDDIVGAIAGKVDPRESQREFNEYFSAVAEKRRIDPQDDVISKLVHGTNQKDESLSTPEVLSFCLSLLVAGNETTTGLIGNLFFELAKRPEDWRRLREEPALVASAVEESLRFDAPNQGLFRHTTCDVEMHGVTIPAGKKVLLLFGAAGRDPRHFPEPERFDIARSPNRHIAFGAGIHHCLGANIGRLEANIALETAVTRVSELRLVDAEPPYVPVFFIRCPEHFRVELKAG